MIIAAIIYVVGAVLYGGFMLFLLMMESTMSLGRMDRSHVLVAIIATILWPLTLLIQACVFAYAVWEMHYWSRR